MRAAQFTRKFKSTVIQRAKAHVAAWNAAHEPDAIERAFNADLLKEVHVEIWFALHAALAGKAEFEAHPAPVDRTETVLFAQVEPVPVTRHGF